MLHQYFLPVKRHAWMHWGRNGCYSTSVSFEVWKQQGTKPAANEDKPKLYVEDILWICFFMNSRLQAGATIQQLCCIGKMVHTCACWYCCRNYKLLEGTSYWIHSTVRFSHDIFKSSQPSCWRTALNCTTDVKKWECIVFVIALKYTWFCAYGWGAGFSWSVWQTKRV